MASSSLEPVADDNIEDSVLSLLECPICMEFMVPPIVQCVNGHTLCPTCRSLLSECPMCQCPFTYVPCRVLDSLASHVLYPCKNQKQGCKVQLPLSEKLQHELKCVYKLYECLPGKDTGCNWTGSRDKILDHVSKEHPLRLYTPGGDVIHSSVSINHVYLVDILNELFWYYKYQCSERRIFFRALQYIGPKEDAASLFCTYEFPLEHGTIKYQRCAYTEDDDIYRLIEKESDPFNSLVNLTRKHRNNDQPNFLFCYTKIEKF